ncbi:TetR/AcrR family transcriptional regulator [Larsenimonas rhizosphaerae]|uniref:TetR/AcrR family transcriptional regulator n=1 Tax=Larsenimonas rhizosphaerae TaxID=2944682 RepID=UPI002033CC8A|nr:TetR/AcrR family transcriptional regulator [Larsenimonas rhizosphaerae]MCM2129368.1 TetR/AcrR family transcriptional regulator [Larsenimonas rhizosphaerae]
MAKREDILETARQLFNAHGFQAVGVDCIRDKTPASKMTLYKHFSTKEGLIAAVLADRHDRFSHSLEQALTPAVSLTDMLARLFGWHRAWFCSSSFNGCMFIRARDEYCSTSAVIEQQAARHKAWLHATVHDHMARFDAGMAKRHGQAISMLLDGMIVQTSPGHDRVADTAWISVIDWLGLDDAPSTLPAMVVSL